MKIDIGCIIFKYLWVLIILPKEIQTMVLLGIVFAAIIKTKKVQIDIFSGLILMYIIAYVVSFLYNIIIRDYPSDRILATLNNIAIWVFAVVIYSEVKIHGIDLYKLKKYCFINLLILTVLGFIAIYFYYIVHKGNIFFIYKLPLYESDWLNDMKLLRLVALLDYPNLIPLLFMILFPWAYEYLNETNKNKIFYILLWIPLILSLSRSGLLCVLFSLIILSYYFVLNKFSKKFYYVYMFVISFIGVILIVYSFINIDKVLNIADSFINSRESSNTTRFGLYQIAIERTLNNSPLLGMAIKVPREGSVYLVGSHSTYIGFFYKTGILGTLVMMFFMYNLIKIIFIRLKNPLLRKQAAFMIGLIINFSVEDWDGTNWLILIFFISIALLKNQDKFIVDNRR